MQREDFARWREDPVTRQVFAALEAAETAQKSQWDAAAWEGGTERDAVLMPLLRELRIRADCYAALRELDVEQVNQWLGLEDEG